MAERVASGEADALARDQADPLSQFRDRFLLPEGPDGAPAVYLAGQPLGLQPRTVRAAIEAQLDAWARLGIDRHFAPGRPWFTFDDPLREPMARIVGATRSEVAILNSLTVNIHLLLASFFRPAGRRRRILTAAPLAIFDEVGMPALRARSMALTGYLSSLLDDLPIEVITPRDPAARGCQLSVRFAAAESVLVTLAARGVVADFRAPDIIRVAPVPFYNTYHDASRLARRPGPSGPGYDSQSYAQGIGIGIDVSRRSATLGSRRLERELAIHAGRSAREAHDIGLWGISKRTTRP